MTHVSPRSDDVLFDDTVPDPVDLPFEPRPLRANESECAEPGCIVPVGRVGGSWWHAARPATRHRPRPVPHPVIDEDLKSGAPRVGSDGAPDDGPGGTATPPRDDPGPSSPTPRIEFRLTFTLRYSREPHPNGLWVHPDGWVAIVAPSYDEARQVAFDLFGPHWGDLYDADSLDPAYFPRGELLRVIVPAGQVETEDHRV